MGRYRVMRSFVRTVPRLYIPSQVGTTPSCPLRYGLPLHRVWSLHDFPWVVKLWLIMSIFLACMYPASAIVILS